jgi:succinate dehydrogenase/fumarate reductase flavoprotein subunit
MGAGVAGAAVLGQVAGEEAARYALLQAQPKSIPAQEQNRVQDTLFQPLREKDGVRFHQFEDEIREIVTNFIGYRREEARLQEALRRLRRLRTKENTLTADDYHGLMRVNEARNIRAVAESLAISAIERRETRGGAAHVRVDYPEMDDETGRRIIMVEQVAGELQVSSRATEIPNAVFPEAQV